MREERAAVGSPIRMGFGDVAIPSRFCGEETGVSPYTPLVMIVALAFLVPATLLVLSRFLGPRCRETQKGEPYECGIPQPMPPRNPVPIKYYLVAVLFLLFDVEIVFLYPWAIIYRRLGLFGLVEMAVFLGVLIAGFVYVWKRGALEWD